MQEARLIKPKFHYADFATLSPTFSVYCNGLNSIIERHKRVCRRLVTDFVANISTCRDGLYPRLSPRRSFSESQRNGMWALRHYKCVDAEASSDRTRTQFLMTLRTPTLPEKNNSVTATYDFFGDFWLQKCELRQNG